MKIGVAGEARRGDGEFVQEAPVGDADGTAVSVSMSLRLLLWVRGDWSPR